MPMTIDEKLAQLQAIRDIHGGHLLVLGVQDTPAAEFRRTAEGEVEQYAIRYFPEVREGDKH